MTEIAELLRELEWSSIKRGPGSGPHGSGGDGQEFESCPMCGGIAPDQRGADMNFVASAIGHKEACRLHAAAASLEALSVNVANLQELVKQQHEALEMAVEMVDMNGFGKAAAIDTARAALAKYNEMMGEGNEH